MSAHFHLANHNVMTLKKFLSAAFCLLLCAAPGYAQKQGKTVYAFGYATCLGDSAIYLSTIQPLDSAQLQPKTGFLLHRSAYTAQMQQTLNGKYGKHFTCAIFFSDNQKKIEKEFSKIRHEAEKTDGCTLQILPLADFRFTAISDPEIISH